MCLVQEETVKTCFCHKSVHKQEVFASKKTPSDWWKKAPDQPITKLYGKPLDLVAEEQVVGRGSGRRVTAAVTMIETAIEIAIFES